MRDMEEGAAQTRRNGFGCRDAEGGSGQMIEPQPKGKSTSRRNISTLKELELNIIGPRKEERIALGAESGRKSGLMGNAA